MMIERAESLPHAAWLSLRSALWPYCTEAEHRREMAEFLADPRKYAQFIAYDEENHPVGLAEASLRYDYVNGTETSPVAFLEGLYVIPPARQRGIAKQLVEAVASWASGMNCTELASDVLLDNHVSQIVHQALGFQETERVVFFRKPLSPRMTPEPSPPARLASQGLP